MERVLAMALVHDAPEALTGDLPRTAAVHLPPGAKHAMEGEIARDLVEPLSTAAARAWSEYQSRETRESCLVALCDRLQLGVRLVGYQREGRSGLDEFRRGLEELDCTGFAPAQALLDEILEALG